MDPGDPGDDVWVGVGPGTGGIGPPGDIGSRGDGVVGASVLNGPLSSTGARSSASGNSNGLTGIGVGCLGVRSAGLGGGIVDISVVVLVYCCYVAILLGEESLAPIP